MAAPINPAMTKEALYAQMSPEELLRVKRAEEAMLADPLVVVDELAEDPLLVQPAAPAAPVTVQDTAETQSKSYTDVKKQKVEEDMLMQPDTQRPDPLLEQEAQQEAAWQNERQGLQSLANFGQMVANASAGRALRSGVPESSISGTGKEQSALERAKFYELNRNKRFDEAQEERRYSRAEKLIKESSGIQKDAREIGSKLTGILTALKSGNRQEIDAGLAGLARLGGDSGAFSNQDLARQISPTLSDFVDNVSAAISNKREIRADPALVRRIALRIKKTQEELRSKFTRNLESDLERGKAATKLYGQFFHEQGDEIYRPIKEGVYASIPDFDVESVVSEASLAPSIQMPLSDNVSPNGKKASVKSAKDDL